MDRLPPLRTDIELIPLRHEGRDLIVVRDPLEISPPDVVFHAGLVRLLPFFDGATPPGELQAALSRWQGGVIARHEEVESLVRSLDEAGLLQSERYRERRDAVRKAFFEAPVRPAALAGGAYPEDAGELAATLDRILAAGPRGGGEAAAPVALAAPHLDLRVAGGVYGAAYAAIAGLKPSGVLLLGTGHSLPERYCLTQKDYETPLGRVPTDKAGAARLRELAGDAAAADDFAHGREHSIEFQCLFLQRLFPMAQVPVLPVLCGPFDDLVLNGTSPLEEPGIAALVGGLREWLAAAPGRIAVAGVDLCHVGRKFGDAQPAAALDGEVRDHDGRLLDALVRGDLAGFARAGAEGRRYKVCGFSALWTLMAALPGARGTVLDYHVWHEEPTASAVSCAAVALHGGEAA